jgi:hypothetical protein
VEELYQDVTVLNTSDGNVTLLATPAQAGRIIYASENYQLWLVLRPTIGTKPKLPIITGVKAGG